MCGIYGLIGSSVSLGAPNIMARISKLAKLSESRGKEASGLALLSNNSIYVYRESVSSSKLVRSPQLKILESIIRGNGHQTAAHNICIMGHSRLVTNGTQEDNYNNQPVIKDGVVGIHNGIITNSETLWNKYNEIKRCYEIDTEIILALLKQNLCETQSIIKSIQNIDSVIEGTYSLALIFDNLNKIVLATNNGSLYFYRDNDNYGFASEKNIMERYCSYANIDFSTIRHINAGEALIIDIISLKDKLYDVIDGSEDVTVRPTTRKRTIIEIDSIFPPRNLFSLRRVKPLDVIPMPYKEHESRVAASVDKLKRCKRCLLPATFPFIEFDSEGVCSICWDYKKIEYKGEEKLHALADQARTKSSEPDCIVALSGGRDSSYTLHYVINTLKLKPLAYTYDWGMVTDLARRNVYRMCGKLGVEHILVSADINRKRRSIQHNISAWLKKPNLGMIPLFMAGDKQYISNAIRIGRENDIKLVIFGYNPYEHTGFKSGFAGVDEGNDLYYKVNFRKKISIIKYYVLQFLRNPSYLNSSIVDTMHAFQISYVTKRDYLQLFTYFKWDEKHIQNVLNHEYNWEEAQDTGSTWRIGDGTAAFYNYIYYIVAGFTENDTFYSNMIREGEIDRDDAYNKVLEVNQPRYESIKWYCDIIGLDFHNVIKRINKIPKLYPFGN